MATLNHKIAPFVFWLCFLALSFFTTFNGQSQSAHTSLRDRQAPAKPLCQDGPRGASGPMKGSAADHGSSPPTAIGAPPAVRERTNIAAAGFSRGQEFEGRFR